MARLRNASLIAATVGFIGSVALMLMSGLRPPVFLIILFIGWVSAPFAVLVFLIVFLNRRIESIKHVVYWLTIAIAAGSLATYTYALFRPGGSQPAFPYVAVPIVSVALMIAVIAASVLMARKL